MQSHVKDNSAPPTPTPPAPPAAPAAPAAAPRLNGCPLSPWREGPSPFKTFCPTTQELRVSFRWPPCDRGPTLTLFLIIHLHITVFAFFLSCAVENRRRQTCIPARRPGLFCVAFNAPQLLDSLNYYCIIIFSLHRCNFIGIINNNNK